MNDKSWRDTIKHGISKSKPVYAAQMAVYQAYMEASVPGISSNPVLFTAINKGSEELWFELVPFDGGLAQRMSTLIAAEKTQRRARLAELDPKYVDVIVKRWQDYTGKQATRLQDGTSFIECSAQVRKMEMAVSTAEATRQ